MTKAKPQLSHSRGNCYFCFNRKFQRVVTWQFSCSLVPEFCHFRHSSKTGNISATLNKQTDLFNRGPSALPLRVIEDEELTPFRGPSEIKELVDASTLFRQLFMSSQDRELQCQADATNSGKVTDPFFALRKTIYTLWLHAYTNPEVANMLISIQLCISLGNVVIYTNMFYYLKKYACNLQNCQSYSKQAVRVCTDSVSYTHLTLPTNREV